MAYTKPLPAIDLWNRPFWDACKQHRLIAQKCAASGKVWFPPSPVSPITRDKNWSWVTLSGAGRVVSWVVMHQKYFPGFASEIPYLVAQVELDEGPVFVTNIVDARPDNVSINARVQAVFDPVTEEITLPKFSLAESAA